MTFSWSPHVRKRADRDHAAKKAARRRRQHLEEIKGPVALRRLARASRRRQPR